MSNISNDPAEVHLWIYATDHELWPDAGFTQIHGLHCQTCKKEMLEAEVVELPEFEEE